MNQHRNECEFVIGDVKYKVRATLNLLEDYENRFLNQDKKGTSFVFRVAGFLMANSDKALPEDEAAEAAFSNGSLEECTNALTAFFATAYKTGEVEKPAGKPQRKPRK